jgi:hypothetical protein
MDGFIKEKTDSKDLNTEILDSLRTGQLTLFSSISGLSPYLLL